MDPADSQFFESYRPRMFSIAYRMLGSVAEAQDILQDAFLRYQAVVSQQEIAFPNAFFSTIVTRLCINRLESAQMQRETYIGPWLPEPILSSSMVATDVSERVEIRESLSMAFLVLLEQLTPLERAVFLLRQVFDYDYSEIAEMLGKDQIACRQLFARAKKHIAENRPRFQTDPQMHQHILTQFIAAISKGDLDGLLQLLSENVTMRIDSGGKTRGAALKPIHGCDAVARFLVASPNFAIGSLSSRIVAVNGEPALVLSAEEKVFLVAMIHIDQAAIREICVISNPEKLKGVIE